MTTILNLNDNRTLVIGDDDEDGETCDGCGEAGAMCEADGFVFHNGTCWAKAEDRYYRTKSGARTWLRSRLLAAWDEGLSA
jgi:hypothetical protein